MSKAASGNTTELQVHSGMHIESPDGVIAKPAINPDTEAAASAEPKENFDPRKAMMDAIVANRSKSFEKELDYAEEISPKSFEQEDAEALARDNAQATAQAAQNVVAPPEEVTPPVLKKTIVVDGQQMEFTEDELIRLAQRGMSADQRFQEAARMRDDYNRALAASQGQQNYQPTAPAAGYQPAQSQASDEPMLKEISRRISYGSEEEQQKAVADLINVAARTAGRSIPQGPSPDQLVNVATQHALATIRFEQNMDTIGREYHDIFADEDLTIIAARQANKLDMKYKMLGQAKTPLEIYREAGDLVRDKYLKDGSAPQGQSTPSTNQPSIQSAIPAVSPSMAAKVERKRVAPQPPAAANRIASDSAQTSYPTGSQIVAQMRKSRHQSAY